MRSTLSAQKYVLPELPPLRMVRTAPRVSPDIAESLRARLALEAVVLNPLPALEVATSPRARRSPTATSAVELLAARSQPRTAVVELDLTTLTGLAPEAVDRNSGLPVTLSLAAHAAVTAIREAVGTDLNESIALALLESVGDRDQYRIVREADSFAPHALHDRLVRAPAGDFTAGSGGKFTLTVQDAGPLGLEWEIPELAVGARLALSLGRVIRRPAVVESSVGETSLAVRQISYLGVCYDGELLTRTQIAGLLRRLRGYIEDPGWLRRSLGLTEVG